MRFAALTGILPDLSICVGCGDEWNRITLPGYLL